MFDRRFDARAYLVLLVARYSGIALFFLGVAVATIGQLVAQWITVVGVSALACGFVLLVVSVLGIAVLAFAICLRTGFHGLVVLSAQQTHELPHDADVCRGRIGGGRR